MGLNQVSGREGIDQVDASPQLEITTEDRNGIDVMYVSGEVDLSNVALLREALDKVHTSRHVVLDCQRLRYMDSTGLHVLGAFPREGRRLVLAAPSPTIRKILGTTGLDTLIPIVPTVEDALKLLKEKSVGPTPSGE